MNSAVADRLRALPEEKAEPYGWEEFRRRSTGIHRGAARGAAADRPALRAAAAILLMAGATALGAWIWGRSEVSAGRSVEARSSSAAVGAVEQGDRPESLEARTRAAELWLARQPADPAMVRVGAYATVAGLEDRIAQLDDLLTTARAEGGQSASLSSLEAQRARLVTSLAQVRFAETLVAESSP
ncbi:MAG TPA: hypothetical protein VEV18_02000 [Steroidobacteraceae bacterium]|nr:hypothetical protein [Steroidobacteraceae bacterium]